MDQFDKLAFKFDSLSYLKKLIEKWKYLDCKKEKDYENSLYKFLHLQLPDIQITKQFAEGRVKADLKISDDIIVELKVNLNKRDQFQRLLGQLQEYKAWKGKTVLVLIGETEPNMRKELEKI